MINAQLLYCDHDQCSYVDAETFERHHIERHEAAVYRFDQEKFFKVVADLFCMPVSTRRMQDVRGEGLLWHLGACHKLDYMQIYIVRGLNEHLSFVLEAMSHQPGPALVLTTSRTAPPQAEWPSGLIVKRLPDICLEENEQLSINTRWLRQLSLNNQAKKPTEDPLISYDATCHKLSIKDKKDWFIRGDQQRALVEYMYVQRLQGRFLLGASEILAKIRRPGKVGGVKRVRDLFRGEKWKDYIRSPKKGFYEFDI